MIDHKTSYGTTSPEIDLRLKLIRCRLERALFDRQQKATSGEHTKNEFSGLYISEQEVKELLLKKVSPIKSATGECRQNDVRTEMLRRKIREFPEEKSLFSLLQYNFGFSEMETFICLFIAASELDPDFDTIIAFLQDGLHLKRPTVSLITELFIGNEFSVPEVRHLLGPSGTLCSSGLVHLANKNPKEKPSFFSCQFIPADPLVDFWLNDPKLSVDLQAFAVLSPPRQTAFTGAYYRNHLQWIDRQKSFLSTLPEGAAAFGGTGFLLLGLPGLSLGKLIANAAYTCNRRIITIDMACFLPELPQNFEPLWKLIVRDTKLWSAFLHLDFLGIDDEKHVQLLINRLPKSLFHDPSITWYLTARSTTRSYWHQLPVTFHTETFDLPGRMHRRELWERAWKENLPAPPDEKITSTLAIHYQFTPAEIEEVILTAKAENIHRDNDMQHYLTNICRRLKSHNLNHLASRINCHYQWEDLVLPPDVLTQLREICNMAQLTGRVYDDWGFENKFSMGKGLTVLFSGASGTGKTMCAEIIANTLDLELYRIDLSMIVSKYIGETEKNITLIFNEAQVCNGILLFDEADALFGKRSEVKDAHDRYANIEIDHLLQKLEEYDGIVILTTNLLQNLDSAFMRRIKHIVDFPLPDECHREKLWNKVFPEATPQSDRIDYAFLSKKFNLTGANIKNVALTSAFLAASNGRIVEMHHIIWAIKREYQKMGRFPNRSDFGPYYELIKEGAVG